LPLSLQTAEASKTPPQGKLQASLNALEHEMIIDASKSSRGNAASAARFLEISERIIRLRMRKLGINSKRFKQTIRSL
jgi:Nif-specific regulatory protein